MKRKNELKERAGTQEKPVIKYKIQDRNNSEDVTKDGIGDPFITLTISFELFEKLLRQTDLATSTRGGYTDEMRIDLLLDIKEMLKRQQGKRDNIFYRVD